MYTPTLPPAVDTDFGQRTSKYWYRWVFFTINTGAVRKNCYRHTPTNYTGELFISSKPIENKLFYQVLLEGSKREVNVNIKVNVMP